MADKKEEVIGKAPFLEFAPKALLQFCGGLVALSLALVQVGFDEVVDAYAQSIVMKLENQSACPEIDYAVEDTNTELWDRVELNEHAILDLQSTSHTPTKTP